MLKVMDRTSREALEHATLSECAAFADQTRGRLHPMEEDPYRTAFQRDRDRILHSKSFRRLSHKTQVFLSPEGDHFRTRLTHTLEVSQIARSICRGLALNEDLTEAIALGHDLGHTPFGHTGEASLCRAIARRKGIDPSESRGLFEHSEQSVRVVEFLEHEGEGLNLTREVVDGILCHNGKQRAQTLEGRIVATADRIAYINHDIDDAIRAGVLSEADLPKSTHRLLGTSSTQRITTLVEDMISNSARIGDDIAMSAAIWDAMMELRAFMFEHVYAASDAKAEEPKADRLIEYLFDYYLEHFDEVPPEYRRRPQDGAIVEVSDYIAGMTDRYAVHVFEELAVPQNWATRLR